jgi:hypothetical protein
MNNSHLSMRNLATVAIVLFGSMTVAPSALAAPVKVIKVDPNAQTFTVQWAGTYNYRHSMETRTISRQRTFKTTGQTTYWVGEKKGSWENLTKGALVNVTAHSSGSDKVADKVQIVTGS